jgi:hypothetical protein
VFIQPQGSQLTADQARALDDDFFTSRPFEFFASRIVGLIDASAPPAGQPESALAADFAAALGIEDGAGLLGVGRVDRELQTALDAFVVRHHIAEALVRFYYVITVARQEHGAGSGPWCGWAEVSNSPTATADVVNAACDHLLSDRGRQEFKDLVIEDEPVNGVSDRAARAAMMGDWLLHAMRLLMRKSIDVNAANNKIKHGLAVRTRDDERITFIPECAEDGSIPVSVFTGPGAIDLIDTISVDVLSQPRRRPRQGLEITTLQLPPAVLLAESWMMAVTYGAMFHIEAARHFGGHEVNLPRYPEVPPGPSPHDLLQGSVVGLRHPLTTPPDGGRLVRGAGIATHEDFLPISIDYTGARDGVVVDG